MDILFNIGVVLLLILFFGTSIFVHELGHFLVARWCGLKIEVFSIGFGPAIWKRTCRGVIYKIGIFPLGGYVALPQLDPSGMSRIQGKDGEAITEPLPAVAAWRKILVSAAGATGNILFAILIAWIVYLKGVPAEPAELSSVVGYVEPVSTAYVAGVRIGDTVTAVNGQAVATWQDFRILSALDTNVDIELRKPSGVLTNVVLATSKGVLGEQTVAELEGPSLCMVLIAEDGMSAAEAGLQRGDTIVSFNGTPVLSRGHLQLLVRANADVPVTLGVERMKGREITLIEKTMTPKFDPNTDSVRIGIMFNTEAVAQGTVVHPLPSEQIKGHSLAIFRFLKALTTPRQAKAAAGAVGGPVAIVFSYWIIFKISIMKALWFTGFLNVNLAILNLLPIPVLDGGHICFALWEGITRRPPSPRVVNILVNLFAVLLLALFVLLSVRDVQRFF